MDMNAIAGKTRRGTDEGRGSMWLLPALLVGALLLAIATTAHAGMYRWVDAQGSVHYSDRLPADAVDRASSELNRNGVVVRSVGQAPTGDQLRARQAETTQKRELAREKMASERRDRALLDSYTSEDDIDLAKARALSTIEGQITSAQAYIAQIDKRRRELEALKPVGAQVSAPASARHELDSIDTELARQAEFIVGKQKEAAAMANRYDLDKQRYHELKGTAFATGGAQSATRFSVAESAPFSQAAAASPPRR
jgi:hypothetical protein